MSHALLESERRIPARRPRRRDRSGARPASPRRGRMAEFNSRLRFLGAFVREPLIIGAVWPSSTSLARKIVENCDIKPGDTVVELGAGTGAITELLLERLQGRGRFVPIEIHEMNVRLLRRRFPKLEIIHDSAENLARHLGRQKADCIISCLAWGSMLPPTQNRIFEAVLQSLAPGGQFVAFAYLHAAWFPTSRHFRRRLLNHFARVESTSIVWRNLPPAFVVNCRQDPPEP